MSRPQVVHSDYMAHCLTFVQREEFKENPIYYFHHYHIDENIKNPEQPAVEHCGGEHVKMDKDLNYTIKHCSCKKHAIDKQFAFGHDERLEKVLFIFSELCYGDHRGWYHLESGEIIIS